MSLTTFLSTLSALDQRVTANLAGELGTGLLTQAVADALAEYSIYRPRKHRIATVTIEVDDQEIALPSDFLIDSEANQAALFLIRYGYERSRHNVPGAYPLVQSGVLPIYDSALGATSDPPGYGTVAEPTTIPLTTTDSGAYAVLLFEEATSERTHTFRYHARHQITDGAGEVAAKNTVPPEDQRIVRALALGHAYFAKKRALLLTLDPSLLPIAEAWGREAERCFAVRDEFAGEMCGIWAE